MAIKEITYNDNIYEISYEIVNPKTKNTILFLHGWGSSKEIMKNSFSKYLKNFRQIYLDLPGFGNSSIFEPLKSNDYKKIVETLLETLNIEPDFIVGHSFGGKIGILLNPKNLVLLSSAGIPKEKSLKTKFKIKLFKFLKPLGGDRLYKLFATKDVEGMSKTMYETLKNVVDEDFRNIFKNYEGRAFLYWGKYDEATPLESGKEMAKLIKNSRFKEYEGDHFFFTKYAKEISEDFMGEIE